MPLKRRRLRKAPQIPKSHHANNIVRRREFGRVIDLLNERGQIINEIRQQVERNARNIDVQFTRIAQMQADLDLIKRTLTKTDQPSSDPGS